MTDQEKQTGFQQDFDNKYKAAGLFSCLAAFGVRVERVVGNDGLVFVCAFFKSITASSLGWFCFLFVHCHVSH